MGDVHACAVWVWGSRQRSLPVTGRTSWMREYLEVFKFQAHRPGARVDRRNFYRE